MQTVSWIILSHLMIVMSSCGKLLKATSNDRFNKKINFELSFGESDTEENNFYNRINRISNEELISISPIETKLCSSDFKTLKHSDISLFDEGSPNNSNIKFFIDVETEEAHDSILDKPMKYIPSEDKLTARDLEESLKESDEIEDFNSIFENVSNDQDQNFILKKNLSY